MTWRALPRTYGGSLARSPPVASLANVKVLMNGPSPTLIGPVVRRRQSWAPPPPAATGASSSGAHDTGSWPAALSGGLTVSGGYAALAGLAGATKPNSYGGTA